MKLAKEKKGQVFTQLAGLATGIATLAIVLTVAFLVLAEGKTQTQNFESYCSNANYGQFNSTGLTCHNVSNTTQNVGAELSHAWNSTAAMQSATETVPGWVPLVVIASIGAILLGLVAMFRK